MFQTKSRKFEAEQKSEKSPNAFLRGKLSLDRRKSCRNRNGTSRTRRFVAKSDLRAEFDLLEIVESSFENRRARKKSNRIRSVEQFFLEFDRALETRFIVEPNRNHRIERYSLF